LYRVSQSAVLFVGYRFMNGAAEQPVPLKLQQSGVTVLLSPELQSLIATYL
jgi:hypothetical protein